MGLLDWLSEGLGGTSLDGGSSMGLPPGAQPPQQVDTVLPKTSSPSLQPQTPYAAMPGGDGSSAAAPGLPPQPGGPQDPAGSGGGSPLSLPPDPSAQGAGMGGPAPAMQPPGLPPGAPTDISAQSATPSPSAMPPGLPPQAMTPPPGGLPQGMPGQDQGQQPGTGLLSRALGLNQQDAKRLRGGLGAGLKSVGDNAHKPGLAAFSASAGSAMEGTNKTDDTMFEQRHKALSDMVSAQAKGDTAAYTRAQADYLKAKIALEQKKAADPAATKAAMSPEQRAVKIQGMISADQQVRSARDLLRTALSPKEKQDAQSKLDGLVNSKQKEFEAALTPGSQTNPLKPSSEDDIKGYSAGQFFINPADGKAYRYKGAPDKAATPSPVTDAQTGTTAADDKDE